MNRETPIATIMTAAATAGDIATAVRLAQTVSDEVSRIESLVAVVHAIGTVGHRGEIPMLVEEVQQAARDCTSQSNMARALALLISVAPQAAVARLIAQVLAIGGWRQLIDVLAPAGYGHLLSEIADVYLELTAVQCR